MTNISIAISTRKRRESYIKLLESIFKYTDNFNLFPVGDGAESAYHSGFVFEERAGISCVKNKCLELCMESKADHFFLFDDDVQVLCKEWHLPYINSNQHHLCYTFGKGKDIGDGLKSHSVGNGCMLYFTRQAIEAVGGFDTRYNNKFEHCDLSRRIFNAGLTPYPYMDVIDSHKLIYSLDEHNEIDRSMSKKEMNASLREGYDLFMANEKSTEYIPFK